MFLVQDTGIMLQKQWNSKEEAMKTNCVKNIWKIYFNNLLTEIEIQSSEKELGKGYAHSGSWLLAATHKQEMFVIKLHRSQ